MRRTRSIALSLSIATGLILWFTMSAAEPPGKWQIRAAMPSARTEVAAVELGGKIYVWVDMTKAGSWSRSMTPQGTVGGSARRCRNRCIMSALRQRMAKFTCSVAISPAWVQ